MSQFWDTYTPECVDCKSYAREVAQKDKRIAELERQLAEAAAKLNEQVIDENGTVWTVPTAWAYMKACKTLHAAKEDTALLNDLIDVSNNGGEDLLIEKVWDCLPGDSEDIHQEVRAGLRTLVDAARKERA